MNNNTEKKIILFSIFYTNESEAKENYIINYNRWRIKKSDMFWVDGVLYEKNKDPKETPLTDIDFKMNDIEPKYFGFKPEPKNTKISDTIIGYQLTESDFIQNEINKYSKYIDYPKSDLNDIALIKIDIYLKYLHQRKLELTQPQPATKDINEINTKKESSNKGKPIEKSYFKCTNTLVIKKLYDSLINDFIENIDYKIFENHFLGKEQNIHINWTEKQYPLIYLIEKMCKYFDSRLFTDKNNLKINQLAKHFYWNNKPIKVDNWYSVKSQNKDTTSQTIKKIDLIIRGL